MFENVYVVIARRYGDYESHNYLVGAYSREETAIRTANVERDRRAGKYECFVYDMPVDTKDLSDPIYITF